VGYSTTLQNEQLYEMGYYGHYTSHVYSLYWKHSPIGCATIIAYL